MSRQTFLLTILSCFFVRLKPKPKWKISRIGLLDNLNLKAYKFHFATTLLDGPPKLVGNYRFKVKEWQS
jgi:hypothetical protein